LPSLDSRVEQKKNALALLITALVTLPLLLKKSIWLEGIQDKNHHG
jgi:hypothetical protein